MTSLYPLLDKTSIAIERLDGMSMILPDASLFLIYVNQKKAISSSQIEGTQSSLSDLLLFESEEAPSAPINDVSEVSCYVAAMNYCFERMKNFLFLSGLIKETHKKLMNNARGGNKQLGEFSSFQNWVGGSRPGNANFAPHQNT